MDFLVDFLLSFSGPMPYVIIFSILLACGLGLPVPEDITLFAAGVMSYYGTSDVWIMMAISLVGVLLGDSLIFMLGSKYGRRLTKVWIFHKLLPDERLNLVQKKFNERGEKLLFFARFMPGFRAPIYFSAGTLHVPFRKFILYDGSAALISVPAIVGSVYYFGDQLDQVVRYIRTIQHGIFGVILLVLLAFVVKWHLGRKKAVAQ